MESGILTSVHVGRQPVRRKQVNCKLSMISPENDSLVDELKTETYDKMCTYKILLSGTLCSPSDGVREEQTEHLPRAPLSKGPCL